MNRRQWMAWLAGVLPARWLASGDGRTFEEWAAEHSTEHEEPVGVLPGWHVTIFDHDGLPVQAFDADAVDGVIRYEWTATRACGLARFRATCPALGYITEGRLYMNTDHAAPGDTVAVQLTLRTGAIDA